MRPIAPFRDTALGLKFDSTFTTARTRFGSTLCRAAACSIALSTSKVEGAVGRLALRILALADWLESRPKYGFTSAAADRAACMEAAFAEGTGFQRLSLELQYISLRREAE